MRHQDARHYLGREVIYYPHHLIRAERIPDNGERGVIESVNDSYVFVLYLGDRVAKATYAADLVLANPALQEYARAAEW